MKINHELIRKFIRVFGISLFGIVCFLKFKKLIESGGKEMDSEKRPDDNYAPAVDAPVSPSNEPYYGDDDDD